MKTAVVPLLLMLACAGAQALQVSPLNGYEVRAREVTELGEFRRSVKCAKPTCQIKSMVEGGKLRLDGRIERLQIHHRSGAKVAPQQVAREYAASLQKAGGDLMNPESGENGAFVFKVPDGKATTWVVLDDNFEGYYTLFLVTPQARESTVSVKASDLAAQLQAGGVATLYIEFDLGRAELKPEGLTVVDEIVKLLQQQPTLRLSVEGHTDNQGDAASNRKLSLARAQAVATALQGKGIAASRLATQGHGPDVPIADNRKEEGRAKNRRVELVRQP